VRFVLAVAVALCAFAGEATAAPNPQNVHARPTGLAGPSAQALTATAAPVVISNGTIRLGINPEGDLDVDTPTESLGLQYLPTGGDGLIPGCYCEGWGVADRLDSASAWASVDDGGVSQNVNVEAFNVTPTTAESIVDVADPFNPFAQWRIRHFFHPSPEPDLYQLDVTVENTGLVTQDLVYRRVMDWDIPPTEFNEFVTVQGAGPLLLDSTDDGFANVDPLAPLTDLGARGTFIDEGPGDRGSAFDLSLGTVEPGESSSLTLYYGAAGSETEALNALTSVGSDIYSLGEPSTPDGPTLGTPNTFMFGIADPARTLVLIPGIVGSVLERDGQELWPNAEKLVCDRGDQQLNALKLASDGIHEADGADPVTATDIIRGFAVHFPCPPFPSLHTSTVHFYDTTIDLLKQHGYVEGQNLFVFPYDWRKTIDEEARLLVAFMKQHRGCATCKVDVLAHSLGGLVAMAALNRTDAQGLVHRVATAGTPVLGAPKALGVTAFHTPCFIEKLTICLVDPNALHNVVQNMPGVYEILPGFAYAQAHDAANPTGSPLEFDVHGAVSGVTDGPQTYAQWTQYVRAHDNGGVLDTAQAFRRQTDPAYADQLVNRPNEAIEDWAPPAGVGMARVVGFGIGSTRERLIQYVKQTCGVRPRGPRVCSSYLDTKWVTSTLGDGTVPVNSADLFRPATPCFDRRNGIRDVYFKEEHLKLVQSSSVISWVVRYLQQGDSVFPNPPQSCPTLRTLSSASATPDSDPLASVGPYEEPFGTDSLLVETTGSISGRIHDDGGDFTGRNPDTGGLAADADIPGSQYDEEGSSKTYVFDRTAQLSGSFTIDVQDGADLRIRKTVGGDPASQAYWDLSDLPVGAHVFLETSTDGDPALQVLQIDSNGDGAIDETRAPTFVTTGDGAADATSPLTTAALTQQSGGSLVTLTATDTGGSGVAVTYYKIDGSDFTAYTGAPFAAGPGATVTFYSVDNAGNIEPPQTVTAPTDYAFRGFFAPVDNPPTLNSMNAGRAVPLKFSLGGNSGLAIVAAGYPQTAAISCTTQAPTDEIEQTVTAGGSSLSYDASTDTYTYVWKTVSSWSGTCRRLTLKLNDGTTATADFKFR
jgi:pimeloyl-ACP methyl ester carboxylesterase